LGELGADSGRYEHAAGIMYVLTVGLERRGVPVGITEDAVAGLKRVAGHDVLARAEAVPALLALPAAAEL
jgi:hypothetical protein